MMQFGDPYPQPRSQDEEEELPEEKDEFIEEGDEEEEPSPGGLAGEE